MLPVLMLLMYQAVLATIHAFLPAGLLHLVESKKLANVMPGALEEALFSKQSNKYTLLHAIINMHLSSRHAGPMALAQPLRPRPSAPRPH